ncbi:hypothetical protein PPACK8108_LOCUS13880 [Phakopsora pachyrhizi]|uniref:Uncharacterized protein n=1 Tax=Phakopsora pachyrhizi TaxID=170000 RepID=A0AAV0B7D6_PHAPC|nr:hypothetical protein PPACK8108_LOCUS13880 [Phakopsora pachyrhizi]
MGGRLQLSLPFFAQDTSGTTPLYQKKFPWSNVPSRADTGDGPRGTQQGYNKCNSTTQNQYLLCQTMFLNSIQEFCLWGVFQPNSIVENIEGEMVAYCTTKKFGTRLIPSGAITGVQLTRTLGYIQVVGFINPTVPNLQEVHPLTLNGVFCYKACNPAGPNAPQLCQHIYDQIWLCIQCSSNYPSINGTYQSCQGENLLPAGTYIENGVTKTYQLPPESLGTITSIPHTASIPSVSNCFTYKDPAALWHNFPKTQTVANTSSTVNRKGVSSSTSDGSKQKA